MIGVSIISICLLVLTIFVLRLLYRRWGCKALCIGLAVVVLGIGVLMGVIYYCDQVIVSVADGKCYSRVEEIPATKWGILFGTGRNHRENEYYDSRMAATINLYHEGKISNVFVSGENLHKDYQEVDSMYSELIAAGVPKVNIVCDTDGCDTYRTLIHARDTLGDVQMTLISQHFHNERALYYAHRMQMSALAYDAAPNSVWYKRFRDYTREKLARVKAVIKSM